MSGGDQPMMARPSRLNTLRRQDHGQHRDAAVSDGAAGATTTLHDGVPDWAHACLGRIDLVDQDHQYFWISLTLRSRQRF